MKLRSIEIITISLFLLASSILAQPGIRRERPPRIRDEKQVEKMVDDLAETIRLSASQKVEVRKLFVEHFNTVREKMGKGERPSESQRQKMEKLKEEFEEKVKDLLNEKQKAGFEKFMQEHKVRPRNNRPPRR